MARAFFIKQGIKFREILTFLGVLGFIGAGILMIFFFLYIWST